MTTTYINIEREDASGTYREITLTVTGTHNQFVPGRTYGDPDDCYPDEGGDTEIESVEVFVKKGENTNPFAYLFTDNPELTDKEEEKAKEAINTAYENAVESAMEARAEEDMDRDYDGDDWDYDPGYGDY